MTLSRWMVFGEIEDPFKELFFEAEEKSFYEQKIPSFMKNYAKKIHLCGIYVLILKNANEDTSDHPLICDYGIDDFEGWVSGCFEWANTKVFNYLDKKGVLRSIKELRKHLFLKNGSEILDFLDLAESELRKDSRACSKDKLYSFIENWKSDCKINLTKYSTYEMLGAFQQSLSSSISAFDENSIITGINQKTAYECFSLDWNVIWPLSLVVNEQSLLQYQLLSRHLFMLKFSEKQLYSAWLYLQRRRGFFHLGFFRRASVMIWRMIQIIKSLTLHFHEEEDRQGIKEQETGASCLGELCTNNERFLRDLFKHSFLTEKRFRGVIWNINIFCIFFSDNLKDFLGDCIDSALLELNEFGRTTPNNSKNQVIKDLIREKKFPNSIDKIWLKFSENIEILISVVQER